MTASICCPVCGSVSYNPNDIRDRYCGRCHWWTSDPNFVTTAGSVSWVVAVAAGATVRGMTQREPTPEEVARWQEAVEITREQHPDWSDAQIAGAIAYAVMTPEVQAEVAAAAAAHDLDVELWTAVIRDLQERFPEWTEQECNDNLINLLRWEFANRGSGSAVVS